MNRYIGSVLIIISTVIGAGILALPLVSAPVSFITTMSALIGIWILMTLSGLIMLKTIITLEAVSIADIAQKTLGKFGQVATWIVTLLLLYAVTATYMTGAPSLFTIFLKSFFHISVPRLVSTLLFSVVFGYVVSRGTGSTDWTNRLLLVIKLGFLACIIVPLLPHINSEYLLAEKSKQGIVCVLTSMISIFICGFGFNYVMPSLYIYNKDRPTRLYSALILGTTIPLVIYIGWLAVTLGTLPRGAIGNTAESFVTAFLAYTNNRYISFSVAGFTNITMMVSFLGVTLGLFNFLQDGLKRRDTPAGRLQTALAAFIPPLAFAIYYPEGFLFALKYSGLFTSLLMILLPAIMAYKANICNRFVLRILIAIGTITTLITLFEVLRKFV